MSSQNPPELPRLPPIRESAEQALPPPEPEPDLEPVRDGVSETPAQARARAREEQRRTRRTTEPVASPPPPAVEPPQVVPSGQDGRHGGARRGGPPVGDDGRRLFPAGHALVVAVLALVIGALLLAPGMHKAAYNGQPGTKRDVSLAITAALSNVSHALLLDRPRQAVQSVMGRRDADRINVAIEAPPPQTTPTTTSPTTTPTTKPKPPPARERFTPKHKLRLWVAGDSLVIVPGYALVRAAGGSPVIESVGGVDGHIATGLTRPDVFNWFQEISDKVKELKPNVVVLNFGGNDNHNYMTGLPSGTSIGDFAGPSWSKEYLRRVRIVMDTINRAGATVVWIGLPIVSSPSVTADFDKLNAIVVKEVKRRGPRKAIYIDTYTMFAGDNGGFTEYMENDKGDTVKVRAGDGTHFDTAGGEMIARAILAQLNKTFDLTSWRHKQGA